MKLFVPLRGSQSEKGHILSCLFIRYLLSTYCVPGNSHTLSIGSIFVLGECESCVLLFSR